MAYTTYIEGTTAERFRDYLENVLLPTMDKHAVIVMDNMRVHHAKAVKELLDERKVAVGSCSAFDLSVRKIAGGGFAHVGYALNEWFAIVRK